MSSLIPIYYHIKQSIKGWIINKELNMGEKIPSENELSNRFGVNRLTVRQAISQLVQEGFLLSKRGEGTFVKENGKLIKSFGSELIGFMDDIFREVSRSKATNVKILRIIAPKIIREKLELDNENQELVQIERVQFLGGRRLGYVINYLPMEIGSKITRKDLYKKPILRILENDFGIQMTEALQTIEASFSGREVSELLGIPLGSPILFLERVIYTKKHRPITFFQCSYRGDLCKYIVRLRNSQRKDKQIWIHHGE